MSDATLFERALRRELKKIYLKALGLRVIAGLVSFVTVAAWSFVFVIVWAALTAEPLLWQTVRPAPRPTFAWLVGVKPGCQK